MYKYIYISIRCVHTCRKCIKEKKTKTHFCWSWTSSVTQFPVLLLAYNLELSHRDEDDEEGGNAHHPAARVNLTGSRLKSPMLCQTNCNWKMWWICSTYHLRWISLKEEGLNRYATNSHLNAGWEKTNKKRTSKQLMTSIASSKPSARF